jgi:DNA-binding transcriptional ArsR family regulator
MVCYHAPMDSSELLLHPVRLRIIKAFLGDRVLTTGQLVAELSDVPAGTLYRHVQKLANAGILSVVSERRVRGAVERTYVLRTAAARLGPDEARAMGAEEHRQAFTAYVAGVLADFDRYLASGPPDLVRDGVSYSTYAIWQTDAEYLEFLRDMSLLVQSRLAVPPGPGRRRRIAYHVFLPAPEQLAAGDAAPDGLPADQAP